MKLTGKAKIDYWNWCENNKRNLRKSYLDDTCENALIIEWFDSVGIHILIDPYIGGGADVYYFKVIYRNERFIDTYFDSKEDYFLSRNEATNKAIEKANQIYNERANKNNN